MQAEKMVLTWALDLLQMAFEKWRMLRHLAGTGFLLLFCIGEKFFLKSMPYNFDSKACLKNVYVKGICNNYKCDVEMFRQLKW